MAKKVVIPKALIKRAKKVGYSDDQIVAFSSAEALKKQLDRVSPQTNPDARPQAGKPPKPKKFEGFNRTPQPIKNFF